MTLPFPVKKSILEVECKPVFSFLVLAGIHMKKRKTKNALGHPDVQEGVLQSEPGPGSPSPPGAGLSSHD